MSRQQYSQQRANQQDQPQGAQRNRAQTQGRHGGATEHVGPYDLIAGRLLDIGYSPIPVKGKKPVLPNWQLRSARPHTPAEVKGQRGRGFNVGVAMGYERIIGIDIDTDDPKIIGAVRGVLPESTVAKRGQKGRTDFYRVPGGGPLPPTKQFRQLVKGADGEDEKVTFLEVLSARRQSVVPTSIHPKTGMPYVWLTRRTMLDTPPAELPACPGDIVDKLAVAVSRWACAEPEVRTRPSGPPPVLTDSMKRRHRAYALKKLAGKAQTLAKMSKPGRGDALLNLACALGVYVHHGIISEGELRNAAVEAANANGFAKDNSLADVHRTVDNGLRFSLTYELEPLPERERPARHGSNGNGPAPPGPTAGGGGEHSRPVIRIEGGRLSHMATEAQRHLLTAGIGIFQRGGKLWRPVTEDVDASDGRKTRSAALHEVGDAWLRDTLCSQMDWMTMRRGDWVPVDPPKDVATTILARAGEWPFRRIEGVITTPTLRRDGSILSAPGYDPATGLVLLDPPAMPPIFERPSRDQAEQALELLDGLLEEVAFVEGDEGAKSRSVALSAIITAVARGAYATAPGHVFRSSTPGSGKSYVQDLAAVIATGQHCHVIAAGKDDEEMEKRLVGVVLAGRPIFGIDNVNREIGGDFLCQLLTSNVVCPRPLGKSESPRIANLFTVYANGNGIRVMGDLTRRVLLCTIDPRMERPEERVFKRDPIQEVKEDRGRFVAAALTVVRAYIVAGRPNPPRPLAGFQEWSNTVRGALLWLGRADAVATMETVRAEDSSRRRHAAMLHAWLEAMDAGPGNAHTAAQVLAQSENCEPLREAIAELGAIGRDPKGWSRRLGSWLSGVKTRIVDGLYFAELDQGRSKKSAKFYVERACNAAVDVGGDRGVWGDVFNPLLRARK